MLSESRSELIQLAATIALTHHERVDGDGYPHGLTGDDIPLAGRIVAVADVFDALTRTACTAAAMPVDEGLRILDRGPRHAVRSDGARRVRGGLEEILSIRSRTTDRRPQSWSPPRPRRAMARHRCSCVRDRHAHRGHRDDRDRLRLVVVTIGLVVLGIGGVTLVSLAFLRSARARTATRAVTPAAEGFPRHATKRSQEGHEACPPVRAHQGLGQVQWRDRSPPRSLRRSTRGDRSAGGPSTSVRSRAPPRADQGGPLSCLDCPALVGIERRRRSADAHVASEALRRRSAASRRSRPTRRSPMPPLR